MGKIIKEGIWYVFVSMVLSVLTVLIISKAADIKLDILIGILVGLGIPLWVAIFNSILRIRKEEVSMIYTKIETKADKLETESKFKSINDKMRIQREDDKENYDRLFKQLCQIQNQVSSIYQLLNKIK
jgi:hypothetical protein